MYCKNCGALVGEKAFFCVNCGKKLEYGHTVDSAEPTASAVENVTVNAESVKTDSAIPEKVEPAPVPELKDMEPPEDDEFASFSEKFSPVNGANMGGSVPGKGMGIGALILGIFGLIGNAACGSCCGCLGAAPSIIASIVGLILGIVGIKKAKAVGTKNTPAKVGMILCIIAIAVMVIITVVNFILGSATALSMFDLKDVENEIEDIFDEIF